MIKENNFSIPAILYGLFFLISVYYIGLIMNNIFGYLFFRILAIVDFGEAPFLRLIVLFLQIIVVVKFLEKANDLNVVKTMIVNMLIIAFTSLSSYYLLLYFGFYAKPFFCGNSFFDDNWVETVYNKNYINEKLVDTIQQLVLFIAIGIYSYFKIRKMISKEK